MNSPIIVWEWQTLSSRNPIWVPYTPNVSQHIESEFRRSMGSGKVDLSGQNVVELTGCEIDFVQMKQVNTLTNETLNVRQQKYASDCPFAKGISWKWLSDFQWQFYDVLTSNYIEDAYQQKSKRANLRHSPIRIPNVVHFGNMEQVNRKTRTSRKIERKETKEQYPQANHETANMMGQHGIAQGGNPVLSGVSSRVIKHTSAVQPITQSYNPVMPSGNNSSTYTNSNLGNSNSAIKPRSSNTQIQTVAQSYNPVTSNRNNMTHNSNLGNLNSPFQPAIPSTNNANTQSFTLNFNPVNMPNSSTNTTHTNSSLGNFSSSFLSRNPGFGGMPRNTNRLTHFGGNHLGTSTNINNQAGFTMQSTSPLYHIQGQPSVGHTPSRLQNGSMNSNYGASLTGGTPSQANSSAPAASGHRVPRKHPRKALSPTPKSARSIFGPLDNFTRPVQSGKESDDECAICLERLDTPSDYDNNPMADVQCVSADILQLLNCKHIFHRICLQRLLESGTSKNGCLQCPTCKTIHGVMKGNQPEGGSMRVTTNYQDIPGYPGCGSIVIVYNFSSGTQGRHHPTPGQPYYANAFPRTCYLPNNAKGQKVLSLLKIAFDRQLVFTVGRSVTTGQDNSIVWNDIHHKTEGYGNGSGYGYPDPNYLDNVLAELASHGVTDDA